MALLPIPYTDPVAAFAPFRDAPMAMLLHGCGPYPDARFSYLLVEPEAVSRADALVGGDVLGPARAWLSEAEAVPSGAGAFLGGAAGFFAYELGGAFDAAAPGFPLRRLPYLALGRYGCIAVFDNAQARAWVCASGPEAPARARRLAGLLGRASFTPPPAAGAVRGVEPIAAYRKGVAALIGRIRAGDLFQANLSRRFAGALGAGDHPYALFARLCAQSPAPFCAYLRLPEAAIVSNSPERFLSVTPGAEGLFAAASPIKGTSPRALNDLEDRALARALCDSEKDRAENLMIVDLMRNDLARVCAPGSVRAPRLNALESYANVHHLVSTVEGRLAPGRDAFDLMAAAFPPGSITGAPKIEAMGAIARAEGAPREANYGSIAWFGADGAMDSSVLIRTATCFPRGDAWDVEFRTGGGVTTYSDPDAEAEETEHKAASLLAAIGGNP